MNKHALMLTAATIALLAAPAFAETTISTKVTTQQKTSTANSGSPDDLTIGSGGSVVVTIAGPAIEIDSDNVVKINQGTTVSNKGTAGAIGVQLDATTTGNGPGSGTASDAITALWNYGTIDLTGTGTGKTGILVKAKDGSGDIFNGDISPVSGSTVTVAGDSSKGIDVQSGVTMNGNIAILGQLLVAPSSATSTNSGSVTGVNIAGDVTGNFAIGPGGTVKATGYNATGLNISGELTGHLLNGGSLVAIGTNSPKSTGGNPEAGSALVISNNIDGGILNDGPSPASTGTIAGSIIAQGTAPAVYITSGTSGNAFSIGTYTDADAPGFSFLNRGTISGRPQDANFSAYGIQLTGTSAAEVTLNGGIFNSGSLLAQSGTDGKTTALTNATALLVGNYVNVNSTMSSSAALVNSNNTGTTSSGTISASVSGTNGGTATAIYIGQYAMLDSIDNSATISASATTTDTSIASLAAYAINDQSGTLSSIVNSGSITASATRLDNNIQQAIAINASTNTTGVTITNSGVIGGDILLGGGNDTVTVNGPSVSTYATISGIASGIAFGGTSAGYDTLIVGTTGGGSVAGAITELAAGRVNLTIGQYGVLTLRNTLSALQAHTVDVQGTGVLNLSLSNGFNQSASASNPALVTSDDTITFDALAKLNVSFGSFVSTPGGTPAQFTLLDAPASGITLGDPSAIKNSIVATLPYLFEGSVCNYNFATTFANDASCGAAPSANAQVILNLAPKTASQIGLTGDAAKIFPYANAALATDNALGAAVVTDVTDAASAQAVYGSFVPDLSGSTRAVAISITDQATGPVGARQRALRMYATQPGSTTMWGQEFVQRLTSGNNTAGYRASGFGFALGADTGSPQAGRYGAALTFFSGDQTNKGPSFLKTTSEWYMLTGYTDWRGKGLFLDTQLSFGYGNLNSRRYFPLTDTSGHRRKADNKRNALMLAGGLSTGAVLTYGGTVLIPQLSLDALTMREETYTETGGGSGTTGSDGFDLRIQPSYANSMRGYLGMTVREDIDLDGFYFQPEARLGYRYDFLADPVKLRAAFASVGDKFSLTGPDPERGNAVAGASLAVTTGSWSLGLNYDYLRGNGGAVSQTGTLTLVGRI